MIGKAIRDIGLPPGTTIGAIIRDEEVIIAHDDTVIATGDHVILSLWIRNISAMWRNCSTWG